VAGTPSEIGTYSFNVQVTDSASPAQQATSQASIVVRKKFGRNDSIASATPLDFAITGSLSPYSDSVQSTPDTDFYKGYANAGATVSLNVSTYTGVMDPAIEIVDANGQRFQTCNDPALKSPPPPVVADSNWGNFADDCVNDDIDPGVNINSSLQFKVPGSSGQTPFFLHVFDWSGNARPDMTYQVFANGMLGPLRFQSYGFAGAGTLGVAYQGFLGASGGTGAITIQLASGSSLPPGLSMNSTGQITGTPTAKGSFSFDATATDSGSPAQQATSTFVIDVADPVLIGGSNAVNNQIAMPQATTGAAYSYKIPVSGGIPPYTYFFSAGSWCCLSFDASTGTLSGTPGATGTFTAFISASDTQSRGASATLQLQISAGPLLMANSTMPSGNNGWIYDQLLPIQGGTAPYSVAVVGGAVPPGMTLDSTGDLRGIPAASGTYSFSVQIADSGSPKQSITVPVSITIQ
jgi:hypothetical protein